MIRSIALALALGAPVLAVPVDIGRGTTKSPPPLPMRASFSPAGAIVFVVTNTRYRDVAVTRQVGGNFVTMTERVPYLVIEHRLVPARDVEVFDHQNKPVDRARLPELLKKEVTVLVSSDGKPVDGSHLKSVEKGTLILVTMALKVEPSEVRPMPPEKPK